MIAPQLLLEAVTDVARVAGRVALRHFRTALAVETKGDGSPVTVADRAAEAAARAWIGARFPGEEVLGEEYGLTGSAGRRRWLVDPIDGTKSFVRGVPLWGTLIAVAEDGIVLAGAIHCPAVEELVAASVGCGCWWNGTRCAVSAESDLARATILTTDALFRVHPDRAARWATLGHQVAVSRTWGDCYGYLQVVTGRAEVMVDDQLSPWDAAALIPVVQEAGGMYSDWRGGTAIDGGDGLATNAALAAVVRAALGVPEGPSPHE